MRALPSSPSISSPYSIWKGSPQHDRHAPEQPHEIVRLLAELGVPFATFDPASRCTELSPAARTLLGADAERICRLGARLLETVSARHADARFDAPHAATALDPGGMHLLRAHRFRSADARRAGIVLVLPARAPAPAATESIDANRWDLSRRESEVAALIAGGASTKDVACALGISAHTVRRHTERIFAKTGVRSRMQLAVLLGTTRPRSVA